MLRLNQSGIPGLGGAKVPCVQCDRREYGLSWGDYCSVCREERRRKAERKAQRIAIIPAVVIAAWLIWRAPADLLQRIFAAASVLLVYLITRRIVSRTLQEFMPKELRNRSVERPS
jgi:hypothetical protein